MKIYKTMAVFFVFSLLMISVPCFSEDISTKKSEHSDVIRIALDRYPPLQSPTLKFFGPSCRIITEAFESEGIKVEYGWFPWKRCMHYAMTGEWDAVALGSTNPEREKAFYFSEPIIVAKTVFFHHKDYSFDWNTTDDLKGRRIGIIGGYSYGDLFQNAKKNLTIEEVTTSVLNMKKLQGGRIDITPVDLISGLFMLNTDTELKKLAGSITHHPKPIEMAEWCLMLSQKTEKNKRMLKLFNRGLKRLKDDGRYDRYTEEAVNGEYGTK